MLNQSLKVFLLCAVVSSGCKSRLGSNVANDVDELEFYYWTNEDQSILYRGLCQPGFERDIGLCFKRLSWIDLSDISNMKLAIETDEKKVADTFEEVALIREYDAEKKEELERADQLEKWAKQTKLELDQRKAQFMPKYGSLLNTEPNQPKRLKLDPAILDLFLYNSSFPQSVAVGYMHSCAVLINGGVKCWGSGEFGRLGTESDLEIGGKPGDMARLNAVYFDKRILQVSVGRNHTCVLLEAGDVKCWGSGYFGSLGREDTLDIGGAPGDMSKLHSVNLGKKARMIQAGHLHTCALLVNGDVKCWGANHDGQLGNENTRNIGDSPGDMGRLDRVNLEKKAFHISAGGKHTCVVLEGGDIKCWGEGRFGQLGSEGSISIGGSHGDMANLKKISFDQKAMQVSAGDEHTCAVFEGGDVKCWGNGDSGRLGNESDDSIGSKLGDMANMGRVKLDKKALYVSAGESHSCALMIDGEVKCWGSNGSGKLGNEKPQNSKIGNVQGDMAGLKPVNLGKRALFVRAGSSHSCALLEGGDLKCWGSNVFGQLGNEGIGHVGDTLGDMSKVEPVQLGQKVLEVYLTRDRSHL
jgi:alpha-tubulin suppressor-like RCC1 family protein